MTLDEYQVLASRTINQELTPLGQLRHGLFGLCGEVGEVHSLFQKTYQGHDLDDEHLKKELGDCLWMIAEICTAKKFSMNEVASANINKLIARYPEGFSVENSINRKIGDI
jgi:NTP pyrophosphatase (non-canonical NTP hydrolase)